MHRLRVLFFLWTQAPLTLVLSFVLSQKQYIYRFKRQIGGMAQWVACLTRNVEVVPIKGPHCFLEQETLPSLFSTGWVQEWIRT